MPPMLKNILALVLGILVCMIANGAIITLGSILFPFELDINNMSDVKEIKPFLTPFLAHALGSLIGAVVGVRIAASNKLSLAMVVAAFHMIGGVVMVMQYPSPTWFAVLDLAVAYLPMGYLGWKLGNRATTA